MGLVVEEVEQHQQLPPKIEEEKEEYTPYQPTAGYGWAGALPEKQGLYDPALEKDACGVGFAA